MAWSTPTRFWVAGPPVGKGRPRATVMRGSQRARMYTPARTRDYEIRVRAAIPPGAPRPAVAVRVSIEAIYPRPQRRPSSCPVWMWDGPECLYVGRTDLDNIAKSICDGLQRPDPVTGDRWLEDDRIVVELHAVKRHGPEPGVVVEVSSWVRDGATA